MDLLESLRNILGGGKNAVGIPKPKYNALVMREIIKDNDMVAKILILPAMESGMEMATLEKWLIKKGAFVNKGDKVAIINFAGEQLEVIAKHEGEVVLFLQNKGDVVVVGDALCILGDATTDANILMAMGAN